MNSLAQLRTATLNARQRTGDQHIGTQAAKGRFDVVRAAPPVSGRGRYTVTVLASALTPAEAVAYLDAMQ